MTEQHMDTNTREILENIIRTRQHAADELLIQWLVEAKEHQELAAELTGKLEQEIQQRIKETGGTTLFGKRHNYVMETKPEYDRPALAPLAELFSPDEWAECHYTEVKETEKWDMVKIKKHARARGKEALDIIEAATFPGKTTGKLEETNA